MSRHNDSPLSSVPSFDAEREMIRMEHILSVLKDDVSKLTVQYERRLAAMERAVSQYLGDHPDPDDR